LMIRPERRLNIGVTAGRTIAESGVVQRQAYANSSKIDICPYTAPATAASSQPPAATDNRRAGRWGRRASMNAGSRPNAFVTGVIVLAG